MNLNEINESLKVKPLVNEIDLQNRVLDYCIKNKIDFITYSTVGNGWHGSVVREFSKDELFNKPFATKKETMEQANERLHLFIKNNYMNKKDFIIEYRTFWGLIKCVFYDAKTKNNIYVSGQAKEEQQAFKKLVDLL